MTIQTSATPDYTSGFSEQYIRYLMRNTAESSAAHLLPYLRPGLRVLDIGCGPGSISVGLARAVEPGEVHGVDMEVSQVQLARELAKSSGCSNAMFHVGEVTALDFEDGFFDVVHSHSLLSYVPDTSAVLAEGKRVLKSGGVLACRELICESSFTHPDLGVMQNAWEIFADLVAADEGHPQMGKDMKGHILNAGFADVRMSASFEVFSSPSDVAFIHELVKHWLLSPEISEAAMKYSAATSELLGDLSAANDEWKDHPGAITAVAFGEAIAIKP